jgi:hypothetical protein
VELPAIEGGKPVRSSLIPYGHQWIDEDDISSVVEVLRSDWITQGPKKVMPRASFTSMGSIPTRYIWV